MALGDAVTVVARELVRGAGIRPSCKEESLCHLNFPALFFLILVDILTFAFSFVLSGRTVVLAVTHPGVWKAGSVATSKALSRSTVKIWGKI